MDCRGQGGLSEDNLTVKGTTIRGHIIRGIDDPNPDNLYYRNVFLDTAQTARILMSMEEVDPTRVGAFGLSQGGALTVACAALEPRVSMAIPVYPFLSDYKRAWNLDITTSAYEEINYYFRFFDPHHLREDEILNRLGYIDIQNLAERIQAKVLWVTGLSDSIRFAHLQHNLLRTTKYWHQKSLWFIMSTVMSIYLILLIGHCRCS